MASRRRGLNYAPRDSTRYRPPIGLIGCGGITSHHLEAYRAAGYHVAGLCDCDRTRAEARRDEFYPEATIFDSAEALLACDAIEVVDIATHPKERVSLIESAILAKKHVLSQKPFVLDLDVGARLADLAEKNGVQLAVNQNGRWAPHFSSMRVANTEGLLGPISTVHFGVQWDHTWVTGTPFESIYHLILYDFAIHWFDMVHCLFAPRRAQSVFATVRRTPTQTIMPPLLAQASIQFEDGQATLLFAAETKVGPLDHSFVAGPLGSIACRGPDYKQQQLIMTTEQGVWRPRLRGSWFPDGFRGTMGELLNSIAANRISSINARDNLASLELCFAAIASAETGKPVVPGTVRQLPRH